VVKVESPVEFGEVLEELEETLILVFPIVANFDFDGVEAEREGFFDDLVVERREGAVACGGGEVFEK